MYQISQREAAIINAALRLIQSMEPGQRDLLSQEFPEGEQSVSDDEIGRLMIAIASEECELFSPYEDEPNAMFLVDIPQEDCADWLQIGDPFESRQEAIDFAKERFGADDRGRICLISCLDQGETEEDDE